MTDPTLGSWLESLKQMTDEELQMQLSRFEAALQKREQPKARETLAEYMGYLQMEIERRKL